MLINEQNVTNSLKRLITVELLHRLSYLFTSSSLERSAACGNQLKYWSKGDTDRHRPTRKLQNSVKRHLLGVTFLKLVANSDEK